MNAVRTCYNIYLVTKNQVSRRYSIVSFFFVIDQLGLPRLPIGCAGESSDGEGDPHADAVYCLPEARAQQGPLLTSPFAFSRFRRNDIILHTHTLTHSLLRVGEYERNMRSRKNRQRRTRK